jgi:hypothetical protein
MTGYFTPGFWPREYFGGSHCIPGVGVPVDPLPDVAGTITDDACFAAIVSSLGQLGDLSVILAQRPPETIAQLPAVWVQPWRTSERKDSEPGTRIREVRFRLTVYAYPGNPEWGPSNPAGTIAAAVADVVDRETPPGCWFDQTRLESSTYPEGQSTSAPALNVPGGPVDTVSMVGKFVYAVQAGQRAVG